MIFVDLSKAFDFVIDEDFGKAVLLSAQLRWTRHVMTMSNNWLPKQVFLQSAWTRHRDIKTCWSSMWRHAALMRRNLSHWTTTAHRGMRCVKPQCNSLSDRTTEEEIAMYSRHESNSWRLHLSHVAERQTSYTQYPVVSYSLKKCKMWQLISHIMFYYCTAFHIFCSLYNIFTVLHVMQTQYSDENSVCPSVCSSHAWSLTKRKKDLSRFLHHTKEHLS